MIIFGSACAKSGETVVMQAKRGVIDLRSAHLQENVYRLDGEWELFWKKIPNPQELKALSNDGFFLFPYTWNGHTMPDGSSLSGEGFASFRLKVLLPPGSPPLALRIKEQATAFRVFVDGAFVGGSGKVSEDSREAVPETMPVLLLLDRSDATEMELVVQISNFHHRSGGVWHGLYLGHRESILSSVQNVRLRDTFLAGIIFIIGIYHACLYSMRRNDSLSLVFATFCLAIFFRLMTTGEKLLVEVFPSIHYGIYVRIEYITFFFVPILGLHFVDVLYPGHFRSSITRALYGLAAVLSFATIALPARLFTWITPFWQPVVLFALISSIYLVIRALGERRENAAILLVGIVAVIAAALNDMAYTNQWIRSEFMLHFGLFILILCISIVISIRFSRAFLHIERLSRNLEDTNRAYARFVPTGFLEHLNKKGVTEIELGDQVEAHMAILFSDIRDFTRLSETMSPKENFDFLNSYLKRVSPVVLKHGGFIDKYIGDAVMALFPGRAEDAVNAAVEMQSTVRELNHLRMKRGFEPIQIGIGLHYGRLILGTVGYADRMDGTVISDDVNTASRIEGLTKTYGAHILASGSLITQMDDPTRYRLRRVDTVQVKGKTRAVSIFEVYDGLSDYLIELLDSTRDNFERGVLACETGYYTDCIGRMEAVIEKNPADQAALFFLNRAREEAARSSGPQ